MMKCDKCGKNIPEQIDYCPTCKIHEITDKNTRLENRIDNEQIKQVIEDSAANETKAKKKFTISRALCIIIIGLSLPYFLILFSVASPNDGFTDFVVIIIRGAMFLIAIIGVPIVTFHFIKKFSNKK